MINIDPLKTIVSLHIDGLETEASNKLCHIEKIFKYDKKVKVGWIDYDSKDDDNLYEIDFTNARRIMILGSSGSGKSFIVRGIMNRAYMGGIVPIIITDCAPEYYTSVLPLQERYKKYLLKDESSKTFPMKVYHPYFLQRDHPDYELKGGIQQKLFQFRLSDIKPNDLASFLNYNEMGIGAKQEIQNIIAELHEKDSNFTTMDDLIKYIQEREINKITKDSIIRSFENLKNLAVFGTATEHLDLIFNVNNNIISDINLYGWSDDAMNSYVSLYMTILLRTISEAKKTGKIPQKKPILLVFEELHKFAPSKDSTPANEKFKKAIIDAIKLLRKDGVSFLLATQSSDDIEKSIMKQCDITFIPRGYPPSEVSSITCEKIPSTYSTPYEFAIDIKTNKLGALNVYKDKARDWLVIEGNKSDTLRVAPLAPLSFHLSDDDNL